MFFIRARPQEMTSGGPWQAVVISHLPLEWNAFKKLKGMEKDA